MNRDIIILREAITKVVQMLAGMGLRVTQRGSSAYVQTDPRTLKPTLVNIPFIPDNATDELIHAIQGFMDHEVAHILFTDWKAVIEANKTAKLDQLHNIVEDPFIERMMGIKFPGAAHNIHILHDFFIAKITQPALDEIEAAHKAGKLKGDAYEAARFSVLLVPLVRAWSGQFTFHDFMTKEGHYTSNKFVKLLVSKASAALVARFPKVKDSWEALDLARELHAILYPPQKEQEANQPGEGEPCEDGEAGKPSKDNKSNKKDTPGKGEKEHKNESKNADGDEDSEETPDDANNEAGEGEGEAGDNDGGTTKSSKGDKSKKNKEKKDNAEKADDEAQDGDSGTDSDREDGNGADGDDGDKPGADRDPPGGAGDDEDAESEDDAGGSGRDPERDDDGSHGEDGDGADDEADGADGSDSDSGSDDEDKQDGDGDESGRGDNSDDGDADADGSEDEEGEDAGQEDGDDSEGKSSGGQEGGDDEEGDEGKAQSVANDDDAGDQDIDIDDANTYSKAEGKQKVEKAGQPGIGHVDGDFEDIDVKPYSFEAMVRQHITDEAVRQTRGADYAIYSNEFDIFAKHEITPSFKDSQFTGLEDQTRGMVGVMQKEIERMMAQRNRVFHVGGHKSGKLNAPGFSRILVNDPRVFKRKQEHQAKDTAVSLLVDNSGSMSGQRILTAMSAAYALSSTLDRVNIQHECLGFTTAYQGKPGSGYDFYKIEHESRKLGVEYSRIVPLRITIFKDFAERLTPPVRHRFADMAYNQPNMMSNIDGEAVQIALNRLQTRKEQRKVLLVLSDGMPAGGVPNDLYSHLHKVVEDAEKQHVEVIGIGIQTTAVKSFYPKNVVLNDVAELPRLVMGELKKILLAA